MQGKDLGFMALGAFSILLGSLLTSGFDFGRADPIGSLLTFFIAFFLIFIGGIFWIATTVNVIKEL